MHSRYVRSGEIFLGNAEALLCDRIALNVASNLSVFAIKEINDTHGARWDADMGQRRVPFPPFTTFIRIHPANILIQNLTD